MSLQPQAAVLTTIMPGMLNRCATTIPTSRVFSGSGSGSRLREKKLAAAAAPIEPPMCPVTEAGAAAAEDEPPLDTAFVLLILNCKKYRSKALYQKKTWLPNLPPCIPYYHVIGDPKITTGGPVFDEVNRILWVHTPDDYVSLPKKVIAAYAAVVHKMPQIQYIFKTDDDQILVNPRFFPVLLNIVTSAIKPHYGGFVVDIKQAHLSQYHRIHPELPENLPMSQTKYCSGRFYFLSKDAAMNLLTNAPAIRNEFFEDYAIGKYLSPQLKTHIQHIATNKHFTDIEKTDYCPTSSRKAAK